MRYKRPDHKNALSIITAAEKDMKFTLTIKPKNDAAPTIVRNIYECFRMLGDALLVAKGIESSDHILPIKELTKINANTLRPVNLIDNLRKLRHNINYYGYLPSSEEVEDAISIAISCFDPLYKAVKEKVEKE